MTNVLNLEENSLKHNWVQTAVYTFLGKAQQSVENMCFDS